MFIAKNSYGRNYSYEYPTLADGYVYIAYDEADRFMDVRSIKSVEKREDMGTIYENDLLGAVNTVYSTEFGADLKNNIFTVSRFDSVNNEEELTRISLNLLDENIGFKVFVSPTGEFKDFKEVDLIETDNIYYSGSFHQYKCNYTGSYVVKLKMPCYINSDSFLVGVEYFKYENEQNNNPISFTVEKEYSYYDDIFIEGAYPSVSAGHSYILKPKTGNINDLIWKQNEANYEDIYLDRNKRYDFNIKAYTESYSINALSYGSYNFDDLSISGNLSKKITTSNDNGQFIVYSNGEDNIILNNYTDTLALGNKSFNKSIVLQEDNRLDFKLNNKATLKFSVRGYSNYSAGYELYNLATNEILMSGVTNSNLKDIKYIYNGTGDILSLRCKFGSGLELFGIEVCETLSQPDTYLDDIWNFSNTTWNPGTIIADASCIGVNGKTLRIYGSEENPITVETCNKSLNGINYTKCIKLSGESTFYGGVIHLPYVPTNSYIDIVARTVDNAEGTVGLYLDDCINEESYSYIKRFNVGSDIATYRYYYTGSTQDLQLKTVLDSVKIYSIGIQTRVYNNERIDKIIDFDSPEFINVENIQSQTTIGDVHFYASPSLNMKLKNTNATVNGIQHRRCLCLNGEGKNGLRQIGVEVNSNCNIKIIAKSNGNDTRNLLVTDKNNNLLDTIPITAQCNEYTVSSQLYSVNNANERLCSYVGFDNEIFFKTDEGAVNIYAIIVDNNTESSYYSVGKETITEAFAVDDVITGSAVVTDEVISGSSMTVSDLYSEEIDNEYDDITMDNINEYLLDYSVVSSASNTNNTNDLFECYNDLNEYEKNIYDKLYNAYCINELGADLVHFTVDFGELIYSEENTEYVRTSLRTSVTAFINDNPQIFWLDNSYYYAIKKATFDEVEYISQVNCIIPRYKSGFVSEDAISTKIDELNTAVSQIISEANEYEYNFNSDFLMLKSIFETLVDNCTYTTVKNSSTINLHNAYATLINNYGSCTGLSKAFKIICDELGFDCVITKVNNLSGNAHVFNLVYIDGNWYVVDLASAINNSNSLDDYFMVELNDVYELVNPTVYNATVNQFTYPEISDIAYYHLSGDVNLDNEVTQEDADLVLAYVLNSSIGLSTRQKLLADVDNNGVLTANDSAIISQMILTPMTLSIEDNCTEISEIDRTWIGVNSIYSSYGLPLIDKQIIINLYEEGLL